MMQYFYIAAATAVLTYADAKMNFKEVETEKVSRVITFNELQWIYSHILVSYDVNLSYNLM
jgi:hypothetical protein